MIFVLLLRTFPSFYYYFDLGGGIESFVLECIFGCWGKGGGFKRKVGHLSCLDWSGCRFLGFIVSFCVFLLFLYFCFFWLYAVADLTVILLSHYPLHLVYTFILFPLPEPLLTSTFVCSMASGVAFSLYIFRSFSLSYQIDSCTPGHA